MDMQARASGHRIPRCILPDHRPMRTLEERKQTGRLTSGAPDQRVRSAIAGERPSSALGQFQHEREFRIAQIELVHLTAASHVATLGGIEQLGCEAQGSGRYPRGNRGGDRAKRSVAQAAWWRRVASLQRNDGSTGQKSRVRGRRRHLAVPGGGRCRAQAPAALQLGHASEAVVQHHRSKPEYSRGGAVCLGRNECRSAPFAART
jgi:hypothetical protein